MHLVSFYKYIVIPLQLERHTHKIHSTMSKLIYNSEIKGGGYNTPSIDVVEVATEAGFQDSLPSVSITPWESDNDSLEL